MNDSFPGRAADETSSEPALAPTIEDLIHNHYQAIYRYAYRLCGSVCDAEDLTQQCFLLAHRKLDQLRDAKAAKSWLCQILRNAFLKLCRKKRPKNEVDADFDISAIFHDPHADTGHDSELLQRQLNELPDNYRVA